MFAFFQVLFWWKKFNRDSRNMYGIFSKAYYLCEEILRFIINQ